MALVTAHAYEDGSRVMIFLTPCGYEVTLIKQKTGQFKMTAHFRGQYVKGFLDHQHPLSAEGAAMLARNLAKLYP